MPEERTAAVIRAELDALEGRVNDLEKQLVDLRGLEGGGVGRVGALEKRAKRAEEHDRLQDERHGRLLIYVVGSAAASGGGVLGLLQLLGG